MVTVSLLVLLALMSGGDPSRLALVEAPGWETYCRVSIYDPSGIPCFDSPNPGRKVAGYLYFKQALTCHEKRGAFTLVRNSNEACFIETGVVSTVHSSPVTCLDPRPVTPLTPLLDLLDRENLRGDVSPVPDSESVLGISLPRPSDATMNAGLLFPTFYQVAFEPYYPLKPGEKGVRLKDAAGETIAWVSREFRRALLTHGTGALSDGRVVNVEGYAGKERRYVVLPAGWAGLGINGYRLRPYRSAAVDFDLLCARLGGYAGCAADNLVVKDKEKTKFNRRVLVGLLLYIPRLAGAKMDDGTVHDGFVCAVDVGNGILEDRIDLFVGTDGAGNPYYPACRRENPFTRHGIESLVPSDWRHFELDTNGRYVRALQTEYRQTARHKGLAVFVVPGVKCRK